MDITSDDISKAMIGGDLAGRFNPKTIVYSEMAVRVMIYNALCHFKERHLTNESSGRDCGYYTNINCLLRLEDCGKHCLRYLPPREP